MSVPRYRPARLFVSDKQRSFAPTVKKLPELPVVDWSGVGQVAPTLLSSSGSGLPTADAVVITWADAEWAAMQHVFCGSGVAMPYSARNTGAWSGWTRYAEGLPKTKVSGWSYWGEWRLVEIGGKRVMLWKSNTHLDFPGKPELVAMVQMLIKQVKPGLVLSIGTAGGAQVGDHVGTVRAVSSGTLYEVGKAQGSWPVYKNDWASVDSVLRAGGFGSLLFPVPTSESDLQGLCSQFNAYYGTKYSIFELDPDGLSSGDTLPKVFDETGGVGSLLTTPTFVVGSTAGTFAAYACIEMDDALIGEVCGKAGVEFGFVRNVSDPVQSAALPAEVQGNWGSAVYDAYGIYTSFNGALAAWAMLAGWA
jgi:nucleoside phosphorylase